MKSEAHILPPKALLPMGRHREGCISTPVMMCQGRRTGILFCSSPPPPPCLAAPSIASCVSDFLWCLQSRCSFPHDKHCGFFFKAVICSYPVMFIGNAFFLHSKEKCI